MRPSRLNRKVVKSAGAGANGKLSHSRNAILIVRRMQSMPVDRSRNRQLVVQSGLEWIIHYSAHALGSVRP